MPDEARAIDKLHNRPPVTEIFRIENEQLPAALEIENTDLLKRRDELLSAAERVPATIEDDETAGRVTDFCKQLFACAKASESKRTGDKEPTLQAGRIIDGFFKKGISDPIEAARTRVQGRLTLYLRHKEEVERRRREEAERVARDEAARAEREAAERAAAMKSDEDMAAAITAQEEANQRRADALKAQKAAEENAAVMSRTRGDYGALASLRTEIVGEVDEITDATLIALRPFIAKDAIEKALRTAIRTGIRSVPGCRIEERKVAAVR